MVTSVAAGYAAEQRHRRLSNNFGPCRWFRGVSHRKIHQLSIIIIVFRLPRGELVLSAFKTNQSNQGTIFYIAKSGLLRFRINICQQFSHVQFQYHDRVLVNVVATPLLREFRQFVVEFPFSVRGRRQ
jgi:hypothetical protein